MRKGKFIAIEGIEGTGKSVQCKLLENYFKEKNKEVKLVREPGGTDFAEKVREIIISTEYKDKSIESEAYLFAATRSDLTKRVIIPSLEKGINVITDRYVYSSFAMQSIELGYDKVVDINKYAWIAPDICIYLDLDANVGLKRKLDQNEINKFELQGMDYHKEVRKNFNNLLDKHPEMVKVDTNNKNIEEINKEIIEIIENKLKREIN